uniref:Zonadhesin n=1 Tax=Schizaphis graminum TaxID=13262 RepID=A0A2S2P1X2_SCHGA
MKVLFNLTISAVVAIVVVVSSVNAKNVPLNPISDNQPRQVKPSAKQLSNISLPIAHIDVEVRSTTMASIANNITLVTSPSKNTTKVMSSGNTTTEMSKSNNITTIKFVEEKVKPTAAYTKTIEKITLVPSTTIASVETVTENKASANQTSTESVELSTRNIITGKIFTQPSKCKSDEIEDAEKNCRPTEPNLK